MNFTSSILYLLLLYAVLDKDGKLSVTTGLIVAFGVMLLNCHFGKLLGGKSGTNEFCTLNGF